MVMLVCLLLPVCPMCCTVSVVGDARSIEIMAVPSGASDSVPIVAAMFVCMGN